MKSNSLINETWQEVLIKSRVDNSTASSFIGFVAWNKGDEFPKLGREITEVLSDYKGRIYAKDAISSRYGDKAILFFITDISESAANKILDIIMNYEQKEVYSTAEFAQTFEDRYEIHR
jgi:hypothetical protein